MKVAIVLEATLGGIRKHVVELVSNLPAEFQVIFIYSVKRADAQFLVDLQWLKKTSVQCIELPMTNKLYSPVNVYCLLRLIRIFRSRQIEVLHVHGAIAGALGRMAAFFSTRIRKVIYSPHGGVLHKTEDSFFGSLYLKLEKLLITGKVSFIAVSIDEKYKINRLLNLPMSRIFMIPNGVDIHQFIQSKCSLIELLTEKNRLGLNEDDFVLLYPALFLEAKGHINFFSTILTNGSSLNPNVKILLAGEGPLRSSIEKLIANTTLEKQVIFLGFVKQIGVYYQLSDAVVLPSNNEAFGYVLLEALGFEKMIFATAVGGIKDIVEHGVNGLLYNPNHLSAMIADINYYSTFRNNKKRFEKNSLRILNEQFDLRQSVGKIKALYEV